MQHVVDTEPKDTTLTAYFKLCKGLAEGYDENDSNLAKETLYHDIPKKFRWMTATCRWERRVKEPPIDAVMY